jgi:phosphatidylserine/phosphatidylglycerophosphate/cardiolipin synthase-like enzyme
VPKLPLIQSPTRRNAVVDLIIDRRHYDEVIVRAMLSARVSLWIATANVKDVRVEAPIGTRARAQGRYVSLLERFVDLVNRGVEIRLLHARAPSLAFAAALRRAKTCLTPPAFEARECPRSHLKLIIVDGAYLYLGSANFTGAGLGAKGDGRRNFEMGIATDDDVLLDQAQLRFDRIWSGKECKACRLRTVCPAPLDLPKAPSRPARTFAKPRPRAKRARNPAR